MRGGRLMLGLGRLRRHLHDRRVARIHRDHRERHPEAYRRIDSILEAFRTAGGLKHDYQAYKLHSLREILLAQRPRRILELGTGTSTAVFADYVREHGGELWSIDESAEWLGNSRRLAAIEEGDDRFHLLHADKRVVRDGGRPVEIGYDLELGAEGFELVLVDGPSLRIDGERFKGAVNPDIFDIVERAPPRTILVDIRAPTVHALSRRLGDRYHCEVSDVIAGGRLTSGYRYFSAFHAREGV